MTHFHTEWVAFEEGDGSKGVERVRKKHDPRLVSRDMKFGLDFIELIALWTHLGPIS